MLECISRRSSPEYLLQAKIECVFQSVQYNVSPNSVKAKGCGREPLTTACLTEYRRKKMNAQTQFMLQFCLNIAIVKRRFTVQAQLIKTFCLFIGNKCSAPSLENDEGEQCESPISRLHIDAEMAKRCQPKSLLRSVAVS